MQIQSHLCNEQRHTQAKLRDLDAVSASVTVELRLICCYRYTMSTTS